MSNTLFPFIKLNVKKKLYLDLIKLVKALSNFKNRVRKFEETKLSNVEKSNKFSAMTPNKETEKKYLDKKGRMESVDKVDGQGLSMNIIRKAFREYVLI